MEAKNNNHSISDWMRQTLNYANMMDVSLVFSSNGGGFVFHNKHITEGDGEETLLLCAKCNLRKHNNIE